MALVANALGLTVHKPGMHGPKAGNVQEVFQLFDLERLWKDRRPFVDYIRTGWAEKLAALLSDTSSTS